MQLITARAAAAIDVGTERADSRRLFTPERRFFCGDGGFQRSGWYSGRFPDSVGSKDNLFDL